MVNKKLKTSNKILKVLNENYPVIEWVGPNLEKKMVYIVFDKIDGEWENAGFDKVQSSYLCTVKINKENKNAVTWNDKEYTNADTLISDVVKYNSTLEFPAYTYNTMNTDVYNTYRKIDWYLKEKLHLTYDSKTEYYIAEDSSLFSCSVDIADFTRGRANVIEYKIFGTTLFAKFTDASDACESISSMYVSAIAAHFSWTEKISKNFPKDIKFGDLSSIQKFNSETYKFEPAKDFLVNTLESILKKLKES